MKLIAEVIEECNVATTLDEETGKKSYFIEGIFMQGDIKNRNGRVYPSAVLEKEMNRYQKDFINTKRALGELGHPDGLCRKSQSPRYSYGRNRQNPYG